MGVTAPGFAGHEAGAEVDTICRSCGRKARGAAAAVAPALDDGRLQDAERVGRVPCTYDRARCPDGCGVAGVHGSVKAR